MEKQAYRRKNTKFLGDAIANGHLFKPIVLESSGYIHPETTAFFRDLAAKCSGIKKISQSVLYAYFMKRLSVSLQKGIATAIIQKSHQNIRNGIFDNTLTDRSVFFAL